MTTCRQHTCPSMTRPINVPVHQWRDQSMSTCRQHTCPSMTRPINVHLLSTYLSINDETNQWPPAVNIPVHQWQDQSMYLSINDETNFVILAQQFTELCDVALQCLTSGLAHHITSHHTTSQFSSHTSLRWLRLWAPQHRIQYLI